MGGALMLEIIRPSADELIALRFEVRDRRGDIGVTGKPGLDGVLVGREHIEQMGPSMVTLFPRTEALSKISRLRHKMWNRQWQGALHRMRDRYHGTCLEPTTVTSFHAERVKRFGLTVHSLQKVSF